MPSVCAMDSTVPTRCKHVSLSKLSTSKELSRRDSLSSSRTRDSGYNSDHDVSFSPFDFVDSEKHVLLTGVPSPQDSCVSGNIFLAENLPAFQDGSSLVQSHPIGSPMASTLPTKLVQPSVPASQGSEPNLVIENNDIDNWVKDNLPSYNRPELRVSSITSLSSATSCEMYTDTDMSDDEHETDIEVSHCTLSHSTVKIIDSILRKVELHIRYMAIQCNGSRSSTSSSGNGSSPQQSTRKASQGSAKRKGRPEEDMQPDDGEEDSSNKRRCASLATIESSEAGARFACPFYKHEPHCFRNRRTCPGPGWPTVHRMKEHLYRAHAQSIYCPRCYATFDTEIDLSNHLRSAQCHVSAPQPIEGIDRETLKALRKRSPALRLEEDRWRYEEDRWRHVYHLLFPDVDLGDIPSPFYDADAPSEESRRFRRELLRRVQQELITTAGQLPGPVEHQLLQQVANIIRRCEEDLLTSFDNPNLAVPSLSDRRASDTSTVSTWSAQHTPHHAPPMHSEISTSGPTPRSHLLIPNSMHVDNFTWMEEPIHQGVAIEQPGQFRSVSWNQPLDPITEWIDLDAIILPTENVCGEEAFADCSVNMWSQ